jgi:hypothetical protein
MNKIYGMFFLPIFCLMNLLCAAQRDPFMFGDEVLSPKKNTIETTKSEPVILDEKSKHVVMDDGTIVIRDQEGNVRTISCAAES